MIYIPKHKKQQQHEQAKMSHSLQPYGLCPKAIQEVDSPIVLVE
uniref:Uncharacterized protein n=1 Tax=Medicago truncatula TaxID=3880 RepID=I3SKA3_MEDTR|nr:unknown [Medicago truncatula]